MAIEGAVAALRLEHFTHAAAADSFDQAIGADRSADVQPSIGWLRRRIGGGQRIVSCEERVQLSDQVGTIVKRRTNGRLAIRAIQGADLVKQRLDAGEVVGCQRLAIVRSQRHRSLSTR